MSIYNIDKLFKEIDQNLDIGEIRFKKWPAWPLVKERLRLYMVREASSKIKSKKAGVWDFITRLLKGAVEISIFLIKSKKKKILFAICSMNFKQNIEKNPSLFYYGCENTSDFQSLNFQYSKVGQHRNSKYCLNEKYTGTLLYLLANLVKQKSKYKNVSVEISEILVQAGVSLSAKTIIELCSIALAVFDIKFNFYYYIIKKISPLKFFIEDPDGKPGEVLAAKELGIETIEIQHGIFNSNNIDYAWTQKERKYKQLMPVADRVLVYGEIWRNIILKNRFYLSHEVEIFDSLTINFYRNFPENTASDKKILLYPTQNYTKETSVKFWNDFLKVVSNTSFELWVKVHPNDSPNEYIALANRYGSNCKVFTSNDNPHELISRSDYVVGYTSSMLIEGLALNKPVFAILESDKTDCSSQNFGLRFLDKYIVQVSSATELIEKIEKKNYRFNKEEFVEISNQLYAANAKPISYYLNNKHEV